MIILHTKDDMMAEASPKPIQDYNKQAAEICRLFSSTLQSLAADATAIRQLSSLATLVSDDEENHKPDRNRENKNEIDFNDHRKAEKVFMNSFDASNDGSHLAQLRSLEHAVASIEQKVLALRSIVSEEKRAIVQFEGSLREECEAQKLAIKNLIQSYQEVRTTEIENSVSSRNEPECKPEELSARTEVLERTSSSSATFSTNITAASPETQENTIEFKDIQTRRKRRDSIDPRVDHNVQPAKYNQDKDDRRVSFLRVTEEELSRISRNTLGRINLLDLNEALEEIETVAAKKFDSFPGHISFSSASRQRRFEYLRQQRGSSYQEIEVEAHQGHYWVSEQELRENCVFFRNGESTARGILSILCRLRRLKQIPGKKRQVTYLCMALEGETAGDQL